jgi:hypothetical protein
MKATSTVTVMEAAGTAKRAPTRRSMVSACSTVRLTCAFTVMLTRIPDDQSGSTRSSDLRSSTSCTYTSAVSPAT